MSHVANELNKEAFGFIWMDVFGPVNPTEPGAKRWGVSFTDDASKVKWLTLMDDKGDTYQAVINFLSFVKTQFTRTVKRIRYSGYEFGRSKLEAYATTEGILLEEALGTPPNLMAAVSEQRESSTPERGV